MNTKRAATIVVVGGALAAWLAAAATPDDRAIAPSPVVIAPPVDARGAELAAQVARLHEQLRPDVAPTRRRDLFQFASSPRRDSASVIGTPALSDALPRVPVVSPVPFKLVGLAEDPGPEGPERTAIIAGLGQLFFVKEGEQVTLRYRVAKISADVVELAEAGDGTFLRLALK